MDNLSKRYKQTLGHFCDFKYNGKTVGKLLVNAELEGIHLRRWAETFPSDQTQRTYSRGEENVRRDRLPAQRNMVVGVWKDSLIARLGPEQGDEALSEPHVKEFDIAGKPMKGWVLVEPEGVEDDDQ